MSFNAGIWIIGLEGDLKFIFYNYPLFEAGILVTGDRKLNCYTSEGNPLLHTTEKPKYLFSGIVWSRGSLCDRRFLSLPPCWTGFMLRIPSTLIPSGFKSMQGRVLSSCISQTLNWLPGLERKKYSDWPALSTLCIQDKINIIWVTWFKNRKVLQEDIWYCSEKKARWIFTIPPKAWMTFTAPLWLPPSVIHRLLSKWYLWEALILVSL